MSEQTTKKKLIMLLQILLEETDENHTLSANALCEKLHAMGIKAERKSIYRDVEVLLDCGYDIQQTEGKTGGYYIGERNFELAEVKLLVDAVQASKFITSRKTEQLIGKLKSLVSRWDSRELQRNVFIHNRTKAENETIYYSVDAIHGAILHNREISFRYLEWNTQRKQQFRHDGKKYVVSPWAMTWDDSNYYLIAYAKETGQIRHYRVDKMRSVEMLDSPREGIEAFSDFDLPAFAKMTFSMYGGERADVKLRVHNRLAGVFVDRYGTELFLIPDGPEHFRVNIPVAVSSQFFGWLTGLGDQVQILGPENVAKEYREYLQNICRLYP